MVDTNVIYLTRIISGPFAEATRFYYVFTRMRVRINNSIFDRR